MEIAKRIKKLRANAGLTQQELADVLKVSRSTIAGYEAETKQPSYDVLANLSSYFNVSTDYLLGITDQENSYVMLKNTPDLYFCERLNTLLKEHSNQEINFYSEVSKIPPETFSKYVSGEEVPSPYDMCKIVEAFDTSADYLFGFSNEPHPMHSGKHFSEDSFPVVLSREMDGNYLETELAEKLNLPISRIKGLLSGDISPDSSLLYNIAQIFHKSTDYLLGITDKTRCKNTDEYFPFKFDFETSKHLSKLMDSYGNDETWSHILSISDYEVYLLKNYGFVVHVSILSKLADTLHVSIDYLLGRTDAKITLNKSEESFLLAFRKLDAENQSIAYGELLKAKKQQEQDEYIKSSSIAIDNNLRTGTDNLGK